MFRMTLPVRRLLFCLLWMVPGCAAHGVAPEGHGTLNPVAQQWEQSAQSPYRDLDGLEMGEIVHVASGRTVQFAELMAVAADSRVVYVGEMHPNLADHRVQLQVIRSLQEQRPGSVMVGLEMFDHTAQDRLDQWLDGTLSDADFLRLWYQHWSADYAVYEDILEYARTQRIPLIALNATRDEVHQVSQNGTANVKDTPPGPYHQAYMNAILGGHGAGGGDWFHKVQLLWESTMAAHIIQALNAPEHQDRRMVVLAGGGHIQYGFGIPRQVFGRLPVSQTTILPIVQSLPEGREDLEMEVDMPEFPLPLADFVWSVGFEELTGKRVRLGVALDIREDGVWVQSVAAGSSAESAGVAVGDRLLSLDGIVVHDMVDLKVALAQAVLGESGVLEVERAGQSQMLVVLYRLEKPLAP